VQGQGLFVQGHGAYLLAQGARNVPEVDQGVGSPRLVLECFVQPEALLMQLQGLPGFATFKGCDAKVAQGVGHAPPVLELLPECKAFSEQILRPGEVTPALSQWPLFLGVLQVF
jgi:hypothetical protein